MATSITTRDWAEYSEATRSVALERSARARFRLLTRWTSATALFSIGISTITHVDAAMSLMRTFFTPLASSPSLEIAAGVELLVAVGLVIERSSRYAHGFALMIAIAAAGGLVNPGLLLQPAFYLATIACGWASMGGYHPYVPTGDIPIAADGSRA